MREPSKSNDPETALLPENAINNGSIANIVKPKPLIKSPKKRLKYMRTFDPSKVPPVALGFIDK